jgi:hypothetical protein
MPGGPDGRRFAAMLDNARDRRRADAAQTESITLARTHFSAVAN